MHTDHCDWSGGREAMLCFGPDTGPVVVVALPLFEEANRMRAFAVTLCRALATRGIPVFRFDRRGIGDSTGEKGGFLSSGPEIACAAATFRAEMGSNASSRSAIAMRRRRWRCSAARRGSTG